MLNERRDAFRRPTQKEILDSNIVVATFEDAISVLLPESELFGKFTHILLDQADMVLEATALGPIALADSRTVVLLAGDPNTYSSEIFHKLINFE